MSKAPGNEAPPVPELPLLPYVGRRGKRTSHLQLCGDALQPHPAGRENPKDNAKGLPHQRSKEKRPLTCTRRQRPKSEKELLRPHCITETGGKVNVRN